MASCPRGRHAPAAHQTNDTATSRDTPVLKQTRIPSVGCQRGHQNASHSTWAGVCVCVCAPPPHPANSCISGLLRLHIACDLMGWLWPAALGGKRRRGGGERTSMCGVSAALKACLQGGKDRRLRWSKLILRDLQACFRGGRGFTEGLQVEQTAIFPLRGFLFSQHTFAVCSSPAARMILCNVSVLTLGASPYCATSRT